MSGSAHGRGGGKKAETRLPPEEDPEFQIAPMIDILLVLLVFFMSISSTEVLQTNENVRLPVAKDSKEKKKLAAGEGQLLINVLWNSNTNSGAIEVDGQPAFERADQLGPILVTKLAATPEFRVLVRADKEVRYEYLRTILSAAGANGVSNVTFSVVDKEESK